MTSQHLSTPRGAPISNGLDGLDLDGGVLVDLPRLVTADLEAPAPVAAATRGRRVVLAALTVIVVFVAFALAADLWRPG